MQDKVEMMRKIGQGNRKHEEKCDYCGADNHYAKGLCKNCYARLIRTGHVEKRVAKPKPELRKKRQDYILENAIPHDEIDEKILEYLNMRMYYHDIGKLIGMTKQAVSLRIERMVTK